MWVTSQLPNVAQGILQIDGILTSVSPFANLIVSFQVMILFCQVVLAFPLAFCSASKVEAIIIKSVLLRWGSSSCRCFKSAEYHDFKVAKIKKRYFFS